MGTTTTVSRRMVKMKVHKASKPHAPLPRQAPSSSRGGSDEAKHVVMRARPAPQRSWWQKAMKPAGITVGLLASAGFVYFVLDASDQPTTRRTEATISAVSSPVSRARTRDMGSAYPGGNIEPIVLSSRSTPTDQSFQATSYVRKKVQLPKVDGDCVVKSGLDRVVAECPRE